MKQQILFFAAVFGFAVPFFLYWVGGHDFPWYRGNDLALITYAALVAAAVAFCLGKATTV